MTKPKTKIANFASNAIEAHEANERKLEAASAMLAALERIKRRLEMGDKRATEDALDAADRAIAAAKAAGI